MGDRAAPVTPQRRWAGGVPGVMAGEPGSHVPTQISLCFAETGQRHSGAQRAFLVFGHWGNPPHVWVVTRMGSLLPSPAPQWGTRACTSSPGSSRS